MTIFERLKNLYLAHPKVLQVALAIGVSTFMVALVPQPKAETKSPSHAPQAVDTFIPAGFVLVPIEVQNLEALDSILGQYGVVDLYSVHETRRRPVVRGIKILRSPLNPQSFAVLAPEEKAGLIVSSGGPFTVVIQNPQKTGTDFEKRKAVVQRIYVEAGE